MQSLRIMSIFCVVSCVLILSLPAHAGKHSRLVSLTPDGPVPVETGGLATAVDLPTINVRRFKQVSFLGSAPAVFGTVLVLAIFHTEEGENIRSGQCTLNDDGTSGMILIVCSVLPVAGPMLTVRLANLSPEDVVVSLSAYLQR